MSMWYGFELLIVLIGVTFGYLRPGREDKIGLLKNGIIVGILLAVIITFIFMIFAPNIGLGLLILGGIGATRFFFEVIVLTLLFIIGTFIGDWIESTVKKTL